MHDTISGSCLCGQVTFDITGGFDSFFLCHCTRCQKDTGSAHAANLFSTQARIAWRSGQDMIKTFHLPGTRHAKSFCRACGSALPMVQGEGTLLIVPAGSLDSPLDMRPNAQICYASRAAWNDCLDTVPKLDALPG